MQSRSRAQRFHTSPPRFNSQNKAGTNPRRIVRLVDIPNLLTINILLSFWRIGGGRNFQRLKARMFEEFLMSWMRTLTSGAWKVNMVSVVGNFGAECHSVHVQPLPPFLNALPLNILPPLPLRRTSLPTDSLDSHIRPNLYLAVISIP